MATLPPLRVAEYTATPMPPATYSRRRKTSNRIKMNRDLMFRLSMALNSNSSLEVAAAEPSHHRTLSCNLTTSSNNYYYHNNNNNNKTDIINDRTTSSRLFLNRERRANVVADTTTNNKKRRSEIITTTTSLHHQPIKCDTLTTTSTLTLTRLTAAASKQQAGSQRRRSSSSSGGGGGNNLLGISGGLLWLMAAAWLLAPMADHQRLVTPLSALEQPAAAATAHKLQQQSDDGGGGGREEPSRAVLATMSTQAPPEVATSGGDAAQPSNNLTLNYNTQKRMKNSKEDRRFDEFMSKAISEKKHQQQQQPQSSLDDQAQFNNSTSSSFDIESARQVLAAVEEEESFFDKVLNFLRIFIMSAIIIGDICGNSLVILSVCRHSKLRVTTNWFVVSLACADILVALFAMTFNASVIISGRWLFKPWVCDFWNSCDVLASTASILHLCCISIDRYIAIMRPLDYPMKITTRRVVYILCGVWISSALLSYLPIFTGVYTTNEHIEFLRKHPDQCEFVVNRAYAIVSSSISFWIPCCIMVFVYYRIYREATRQEKFIYKTQSMVPAPMQNHHHQHQQPHHSSSNHQQHNQQGKSGKQRRSRSVAMGAGGGEAARIAKQLASKSRQQFGLSAAAAAANRKQTLEPMAEEGEIATTNLMNEQQAAASSSRVVAIPEVDEEEEEGEEEEGDGTNSGQSTPTKRSISKMKREHKAAKTLGIIMGVFILCWLPFFTWYTPTQICGKNCDTMVPKQAVTILFWIGYFNSTLNPIIYAYFNHEFRDAFKKTLQWIFCCCDLKCLRVNRPNDNQHYNCTYRSTQEIGLVNNA